MTPTLGPHPAGFLGGGAPWWAALGPAFGTHCAPRPLPQLLQGDQTDGAGQRPGHEHTPGGDFPGKGRRGGVVPSGERRRVRPGGLAPMCDGPGVRALGVASAPSQPCGPRPCMDASACGCPCPRAVRLWPFVSACATSLLPWVTRPLPQAHTDSLNTLVALHQLYQYTQKYYDEVGGPARPRSGEAPGQAACSPPGG